jgi:UDP-N-acetylglucosamine 4,6-dehydratase
MTDYSALQGKTLLITGGTGSFGRALARRLLAADICEKIIIFSRDEWKQWEMRRSDPLFDHPKIRYFLGDVRDPCRLARAFKEVDVVVHAAALKHVPVAEYNPTEFVKTNILGAMNVIEAALDSRVEKVIALSTDKAVNPANLYGATKLCADKLFVAGNAYVGHKGTPKLSVVRYGNVLGSRGSIIPFWQSLMANGARALPITDTRMTRFWITLEQSVDFVAQALSRMRGGEIFIPKIPSMRICDLAEAMAPGMALDVCGIREGEKLHELLMSTEEARNALDMVCHYVVLPQLSHYQTTSDWQVYPGKTGKTLPDGFVYQSHTNDRWLTLENLRCLLH